MSIGKFKNWCDAAVEGIVFPPDRERVHGELMNHLYDHYDDLVDQGIDRDTAQVMALAAMGDAKEIAPQLAAIHRPFWGYLLRFTRVALVLTLCVSLWWIRALHTPYDTFDYESFYPYAKTFHQDAYSVNTRMFYTEPNQSVQCDGYTLTLTRAAEWHSTRLQDNKQQDELYFQIEVFNPRPWASHTDICDWFWAVDSLGNTYDRFYQSIQNYAPFIITDAYHTGPFTYTHQGYINGYCSSGAEWIELHYDRSGRDIVFRIDLTGGDTP